MRPRINKAELLERMRANREEHEREYVEAATKYRQTMVQELRARASKIARGINPENPGDIGDIDPYIHLPVPVRYTAQYDRAISMLEWHDVDTVDLEQQEFERWVLNEWEWKAAFAANTQSYTGGR